MFHLPILQCSRLNLASSNWALQAVCPRLNGEVGQRDIPGVARCNRGRALIVSAYISSPQEEDSKFHSKEGQLTIELRRCLLRRHAQTEVSTIVALLPVHLLVALHHAASIISRIGLNGTSLAAGAHCGAGELDAHCAGACLCVIRLFAQPREIRDLYMRSVEIQSRGASIVPSFGGCHRRGRCCCQSRCRRDAAACGCGWRYIPTPISTLVHILLENVMLVDVRSSYHHSARHRHSPALAI